MKQNWINGLKKLGTVRLLLLAGAVLVLIITSIPRDQYSVSSQVSRENDSSFVDVQNFSYEKELELRLKKILSGMKGISDVDVMITLAATGEKILERSVEKEEEQITEENKSQLRTSEKTQALLVQNGSESVPVIQKELSPEIQGVLVSAGGPLTPAEISEISEAIQALFGLPAHRVKVIEKKYQAEEAG